MRSFLVGIRWRLIVAYALAYFGGVLGGLDGDPWAVALQVGNGGLFLLFLWEMNTKANKWDAIVLKMMETMKEE